MSLVLSQMTDPRSPIDHASRSQLFRFAQENDVTEITEFPGPGLMPKQLMLRILKQRGLTNIKVQVTPLGSDVRREAENAPSTPQNSVDATDDLLRQIQEQRVDFDTMKMPALRSECKKRGIKTKRTDTVADLKARLNGQDPT